MTEPFALDKRELKFRYTYKHMGTGRFHYHYFSLDAIEKSGPMDPMAYIRVGRSEYTGLKDKNGKEIYEGDIVRAKWESDEVQGAVLLERGCFSVEWYMPRLKQTPFEKLPVYAPMYELEELEVIGNIYEGEHGQGS